MPVILLNETNNNEEEEDFLSRWSTCCAWFWCIIACPIYLLTAVEAIRTFTAVTPERYYFPCNNTGIIPQTEMFILERENDAFGKIIRECEESPVKNQLSTELESINLKKKALETKINVQNCFRRRCAKINIDNNLKEIKDRALTTSVWLFRIGAVLVLLIGFRSYYKRKFITFEYGAIMYLFVVPIFISAYLTLGDITDVPNFKVNC